MMISEDENNSRWYMDRKHETYQLVDSVVGEIEPPMLGNEQAEKDWARHCYQCACDKHLNGFGLQHSSQCDFNC